MARTKSNGNGHLDETMSRMAQAQEALMHAQATLVQNQAALVAQTAEGNARFAKFEAKMAEINEVNSERFARIKNTLAHLTRMLLELPEAVRDKIGFKPPPATPA